MPSLFLFHFLLQKIRKTDATMVDCLTLEVRIKTAADEILIVFLFFFLILGKLRLDIKQIICMKCQVFFSLKNNDNNKKNEMLSATILHSDLRVNGLRQPSASYSPVEMSSAIICNNANVKSSIFQQPGHHLALAATRLVCNFPNKPMIWINDANSCSVLTI